MSDQQRNQFDEVVDFLVYAPVGLIYEYQTVVPQLVRRGRSQVQLARVFGEMALKNRGSAVRQQITDQVKDRSCLACGAENAPTDSLALLGTALARGITEFGSVLGLAPPHGAASPTSTAKPETDVSAASVSADQGPEDAPEDLPLPIAGYDELPAREIITLLSDLNPEQLARIRSHESATRARKTVLAKLDRLEK